MGRGKMQRENKENKNQNHRKSILTVEHIKKEFEGIVAIKDCSFTVYENEIAALIGPNGAGKTTMFNIMTGYSMQDSGKILMKGKDITKFPPQKRAGQGFSRTFQQIKLFPKMTVMENMLVAMESYEEPWQIFLMPKKVKEKEEENKNKARELLQLVKLETKEEEFAMHLSYGQQKLLEIVQAVAVQNAEIILLDEPTAGVNLTMINTIKELLLQLKKMGKTILFIEHNMEFVMDVAEKVIVMDYGEEIAVGSPEEIQKNKRVIEAYLGT